MVFKMVRSPENPARVAVFFDILEHISQFLSRSGGPQEILEQILEELISGLGVQASWIQFFDADHEELRLLACRGFTEEMAERMDSIKLAKDLINKMALKEDLWICSGAGTNSNYDFLVPMMPKMKSAVVVPLRHGGAVLGVMGVGGNTSIRFDEYELKLLFIAGASVSCLVEKSFTLHRREHKTSAQVVELSERQEFINALSHELQTPLTALIASAGLLAEEIEKKPQGSQQRLIQNVLHSASSLQNRLVELLELSRAKASQFRVKMKVVDFSSLLVEIVQELIPVAEGKDQSLITEIEPAIVVEADEQRLEQILNNLLSNAIKFTPDKGMIRVKAKKHGADLIVEVADTGPGIPTEEQQKLFRPYYRVPADRRRYSGLGLGLFITKQLVELHRGRIWVESEVGRGSTFAFSLPLSKGSNINIRG